MPNERWYIFLPFQTHRGLFVRTIDEPHPSFNAAEASREALGIGARAVKLSVKDPPYVLTGIQMDQLEWSPVRAHEIVATD